MGRIEAGGHGRLGRLVPIVIGWLLVGALLPPPVVVGAQPGDPSGTTSTITATGPVVADGAAQSSVTIILKDAVGTPIEGTIPAFAATGAYNLVGGCSPTDSSGTSTCTLASTRSEDKILTITTPALVGPSATVIFTPGEFVRLQVIAPGEAAVPGTNAGKSGSPDKQTLGAWFNVTVNAVDAYANVVTVVTDGVSISTGDPAPAAVSGPDDLVSGKHSFSVKFVTATTGGWTVTAHDLDRTGIADGAAGPIPVDAFSGLRALVPGQTLGTAAPCAVGGTPTAQTAGTWFDVTVYAVDAAGCLLETASADRVHLASADPNAVLPGDVDLVGGMAVFPFTFRTATAAGWTLTATDVTNPSKVPGTSSGVRVNAGSFTQLQILLPGEVAAPGTATGKTSAAPSTQTVGVAFSVTVKSVDACWNPVTTSDGSGITDSVRITSSASPTTTLAQGALSAGVATYSVALTGPTGQVLTATDTINSTKTAGTSAPITLDTFVKLQILLPGETAAPNTTTGKTGTPTTQTAGTSFTVTVNAVDATWNKVGTVTDAVALTSTDTNAVLSAGALSGGTVQLTVTLKTATTSGWTITSRDTTNSAKTSGTSAAVRVNPATYFRLQVLTPGEYAVPGTTTGKTGTPSTQTAGTAFTVTVNAVDAYWNVVTGITDTIRITSSDSAATLPTNKSLSSGTQTFSVTLRTTSATGWTVTATDQSDTSKAGTSASIPTIAGTIKLQILLPGETAAPNTTAGKTGTPTAQTAGTSFSVTVNAVDVNWNKVTSVTDTVAITSSDANAVLPSSAALVSGTKTFSVTLRTAGSRTVTASDLTYTTRAGSTSSAVTVNPAVFTRLQLLVPGEHAAPGTSTGKTGSPSSQRAAVPFTVTVNAVDAYWNVVGSVSHTVRITSSDAAATLPANAALSAGTRTFSVTLRTPPSQTVTAVDATDGSKTASTSPAIAVLGAPATLTLSTSAGVIVWGAGFTLTARFGASGAYRAVTFQSSIDAVSWTALTTLTTDTSGNASLYYRAARNLWYRAAFAGAPDLSAANSNTVRVVVRQIALLRPTLGGRTRTIARGSSVTFTTTVRPARPELPKAKVTFTFTLYRAGHIVYSGRREVYIDSAGLAKWTWKFGSPGLWYVRAIANPTTTNANSAWSQIEKYYVP